MSRRLHQVLIGGVSCSTNENAEMGVMRCRRKRGAGRVGVERRSSGKGEGGTISRSKS